MSNHIRIKFWNILHAGVGILLVSLVLLIAALQNSSTSHYVHASSGTTCTCGCVEETGECGTTCCTSMSVSPCGCNEPHQTVVVFLLPSSFDLFFNFEQDLKIRPIPTNIEQKFNNSYYESFIVETPSPIPIV